MSWVRDPLLRLTIHCNDEWLFDQLIVDISAFKNFLHRSHIPRRCCWPSPPFVACWVSTVRCRCQKTLGLGDYSPDSLLLRTFLKHNRAGCQNTGTSDFFKICTGIQFPFRIQKYFNNFSKTLTKQKCGMLMTHFITGKPNEQEGVLPFSKLMFSKSQVFWLIWCCFSMCIFHHWPFTHTIGVSSINLQLCMAVSANL